MCAHGNLPGGGVVFITHNWHHCILWIGPYKGGGLVFGRYACDEGLGGGGEAGARCLGGMFVMRWKGGG